MAAVKALATLVKNYGPNMGRIVHAVAEETGIAASKVAKKLLSRGGPLKSKFDFGTIFHHATPGATPSRLVAARGGDPLAALKKGVERGLVRNPKPMGEHLAPFEHIRPSSSGASWAGTYFSRDPLFSFILCRSRIYNSLYFKKGVERSYGSKKYI